MSMPGCIQASGSRWLLTPHGCTSSTLPPSNASSSAAAAPAPSLGTDLRLPLAWYVRGFVGHFSPLPARALDVFCVWAKTEGGDTCRAGEEEVAAEDRVGKEAYVAERLDHLGIVAGVCREIGLAEWLNSQDSQSHERVSVGTATVAMILNGLGFSNRRLYLVPQFFATKAVERLLGPGITAEDRE